MIEISSVLREDVPSIWGIIEPMLDKALQYNPGRLDTIDVFSDILVGNYSLWVILDTDEEKIVGCSVVQIYEQPRARVLCIQYLAGESVDDWLEDALEVMNNFALSNQCSIIEAKGRVGWTPRLKKLGFETPAVHFEKNVVVPNKNMAET